MHRAEVQTLGQTSGNARRLQAAIHSIHAIVALDDLAGFRVPLGHSPRTRGYAALAADTQTLVHEDNAVLGPLLNRAGGANVRAERILAVETGEEMVVHTKDATPYPRTDLDDSA